MWLSVNAASRMLLRITLRIPLRSKRVVYGGPPWDSGGISELNIISICFFNHMPYGQWQEDIIYQIEKYRNKTAIFLCHVGQDHLHQPIRGRLLDNPVLTPPPSPLNPPAILSHTKSIISSSTLPKIQLPLRREEDIPIPLAENDRRHLRCLLHPIIRRPQGRVQARRRGREDPLPFLGRPEALRPGVSEGRCRGRLRDQRRLGSSRRWERVGHHGAAG